MTNERYLKIVTDLPVELPVTSERKWASFQVTRHTQLVGWVDRRLFHSDSATVLQCDNFCCYKYLLCLKLYMTSQWWRGFFLFFFLFFFFWGGGGGGGALISGVFSLVFGVVYWSRPTRVLRRFTALLFKTSETGEQLSYIGFTGVFWQSQARTRTVHEILEQSYTVQWRGYNNWSTHNIAILHSVRLSSDNSFLCFIHTPQLHIHHNVNAILYRYIHILNHNNMYIVVIRAYVGLWFNFSYFHLPSDL